MDNQLPTKQLISINADTETIDMLRELADKARKNKSQYFRDLIRERYAVEFPAVSIVAQTPEAGA